MLTEQQMTDNKNRFLELFDRLAEARKENADWAGFKKFLLESDFFIAPASTMFHANYTGGLCEHCLNVYDSLVTLTAMRYGDSLYPYSWDSMALVALFHDLSKTNYYMWASKNVKKYFGKDEPIPHGIKVDTDSSGKYAWTKVYSWQRRPLNSSFIYGGHEDTSVLMLQNYVWLSQDEIIAILHHTGVVGTTSFDQQKEFSYCYTVYPLAFMLHLADTYSAYALEPSGITE